MVSLWTTSALFGAGLVASFVAWYRSERTLSIHTIVTRRREAYYWLTILFTFALGTSAGDLVAEKLAVGYLPPALIFDGVIATITAAFYGLRAKPPRAPRARRRLTLGWPDVRTVCIWQHGAALGEGMHMLTVKKVGDLVGTWFALIVVAAGGLALATPGTFSGWAPAVPWLLTVIMLGMGMTLRPVDFAIIAKRPWALVLGVAAQYTVMPLLGWGIAHALGMSAVLTAGMILVGCAPGGTASNVMVFLAKGDTALSVAMTSVSTLLAPVLTPLLVLALVGQDLPVAASDLFVSIVKIVLVPVVLGVVLRLVFPRFVDRILDLLPLVSVAGITGVVLAVVAGSASTLTTVGFTIVIAVILHNIGGLTLGYAIGSVCRLPKSSRRATSIEVGMQNSGLAAALATVHFAPAAALPAAIFSVWHNVSGSLLASYWSRRPLDDEHAAADLSEQSTV